MQLGWSRVAKQNPMEKCRMTHKRMASSKLDSEFSRTRPWSRPSVSIAIERPVPSCRRLIAQRRQRDRDRILKPGRQQAQRRGPLRRRGAKCTPISTAAGRFENPNEPFLFTRIDFRSFGAPSTSHARVRSPPKRGGGRAFNLFSKSEAASPHPRCSGRNGRAGPPARKPSAPASVGEPWVLAWVVGW